MPRNLSMTANKYKVGIKWFMLLLVAGVTIQALLHHSQAAKMMQTVGYFEADVTPRPTGKNNGTVSREDYDLIGRFAMGLDAPNGEFEFQRADCAPRVDKGDGLITMADWVQAGRYYRGKDPVTTMGGPTYSAPLGASVVRLTSNATGLEADASLRVGSLTVEPGTMSVMVPVELNSQGKENAVGFSISFDPAVFMNPDAVLGSDATGALLNVNTRQVAMGKLGIGMALPVNQTFAAGTRQIIVLKFELKAGVQGVSADLKFVEQPVPTQLVDPLAEDLPVTTTDGKVTINTPIPTLTMIDPASTAAGTLGLMLKVTGTNFVNGAKVKWNGADRDTMFVGATELKATIPASDLTAAGTAQITVMNPLPGGRTTEAKTFTIVANPMPVLTSIAPNSAVAGTAGVMLTVTGSNFVNGSIVRWNGNDRATMFVSATELKATIPASDLTTAGEANVTVFNPAPGGGTSSAVKFTITNIPPPEITSLSPETTIVGTNGLTLNVNGKNFTASSKVQWNGSDRTTTFANGTLLMATIPASDLTNTGMANVTVVNNGNSSNAKSFAIVNPMPTLTSLVPTTVLAGSNSFALTVNGTNFVNGAKVYWDGAERVTTFVSATQLMATIDATDVKTAKTVNVTVKNPTPGGGTSGAVSFTVANPVPKVGTLAPALAFAGDVGFELTISGMDFVNGATVRWNGSDRPTTFGNVGQLKAMIPASDLALAGTAKVTVNNPGPGGGVSNEATFTISALEGYEADIRPRPTGKNNGTISVGDWVMVGRFAAGMETPANPSEFQRADCAPRATKGDGKFTLEDWVQAGRYAIGIDNVTSAGGPLRPAAAPPALASSPVNSEATTRLVRAVSTGFQRGQLSALPIEIEAVGDENALSFTLAYDAKLMAFSHVVLDKTVNTASLIVNARHATQGNVGVMVGLPSGQVLANGTRRLGMAYFVASGGTTSTATTIRFTDAVLRREVANPNANTVPVSEYQAATITISGRAAAHVSAANYGPGGLAAESLVSAFGTELAATALAATSFPLPTTLVGTQVMVKDSQGIERRAALLYVSPTQVNYQLPAELALGTATVTITNGNGVVSSGLISVTRVSPGVFSTDATGNGWAAAQLVRVRPDGTQTRTPIARFDVVSSQFVAVPISFTGGDELFLELYGTGLRGRSSLTAVRVRMGEEEVSVEYAGAQSSYAGLDQVNVRLPHTLQGRGEIFVEVLVEGMASNPVRILLP